MKLLLVLIIFLVISFCRDWLLDKTVEKLPECEDKED